MGNLTKEQYALLTDFDLNTSFSEAFHTLFANIRFNWETYTIEPPYVHTLLLTSVSEHAEQSAVAANLAIVAAQSGYKTILVDADLRTPSLQKRFGLENSVGLSDLLEDISITVQKVSAHLQTTFIPGLQILTSGTSTSTGVTLLLSPKLQACIECIRKVLEQPGNAPGFVIYHSPPVLAGADASLIGALIEQVLLTVVAGHTTRAQAKEAQEKLEQAQAKLVGSIIVNQ